ncbi:MAG: organic solvent tolerance protein OstA [Bacteroidetes bacterium]|nr:organic solvent tolerance protein OstA [Bacteroidota bacterium]
MKNYILFFLLWSILFSAQNQTVTLKKNDFFTPASAQQNQNAEKIHHTHSDFFSKDPKKYDGNPYFQGKVQFEHQGSVLNADVVILYQEQNFVKAIGNVRLQNPDGTVITAGEMEYDGVTQRGIARKNVVLTDPKQTIKTETLYYDKLQQKAYFNTGGTISDAQNTMYTKSATYNVDTRLIDFSGNVKINNAEYTVEGQNIVQNQNTNTATFSGPTWITNKKNPQNRIFTEKGIYNMNSKEVWLEKNATLYYNGKTLKGDTMYYNQITGFGKAKGRVTLNDPKERRFIKGGYGEIFEKKDSAVITEKPYAVKILDKDSIYFSAEKIITYQKTDSLDLKKKLSFLRAFYKARMYKSNAQARADSISFNETDGVMHLFRKPILWSGEKQVSGDKIEAYFNTEKENIDSLKVIGNAFAISKADSLNMKDEFNQVKGKLMTVYYQNNEVHLAKVIGNAQAINYADDVNEKTNESERIGVAISSCGVIEALFEERKVQIISCQIGANSEVYPMSKIAKRDRFFPDFNWNTKDRPRKWEDILVDSPNNEEVKYESDDHWYDEAQSVIQKNKEKEEAKKPKRQRR